MSPVLGTPPLLLPGKYYQWAPGLRKNQGASAATLLRFVAVRRTFKQDTTTAELGLRVHAAGAAGAAARLMVFDDNGSGGAYPGALLADLGTIDATTTGEKMLAWSTTVKAGTSLWAAVIWFGWSTTAPQFVWLIPTEFGDVDVAPYAAAADMVNKIPRLSCYGAVGVSTAPSTAPAGMTIATDTSNTSVDFILKVA